jgi:hypothetical protein
MILFFILNYFVTCGPLRRALQDINLDSSSKSAPVGGESPKVEKPLSAHVEKTVSESLKPPSPKDTQRSPSVGGAPSFPTHAASDPNPAGTSSGSEPAKSPEDPPPSPRSYGLRVVGWYQPGKGSSAPRPEK